MTRIPERSENELDGPNISIIEFFMMFFLLFLISETRLKTNQVLNVSPIGCRGGVYKIELVQSDRVFLN